MKKLSYCLFLWILFALFSCSTVPVTGRTQLNLIPADSMLSMSYQEYDKFLKSNKLSTNAAETERVKRVGKNIEKAVYRYYAERNLTQQLSGYNWEYNLVESKDVNAWCMPGGKVVIYTGILPITADDTGLAVVMGHEIAHAVAQHGNERMSQQLALQMGGQALATAVATQPALTQQLWMAAFGLGSQVGVLLPYSRLQENEADLIGLTFMAMAGYDPRKAIDFWERMMKGKTGQAPPEWLSTHPADQTRIQHIKSIMPSVMKYYKAG
ncbi:MAG TPA: M48 family metallopeptidase [Syntrophales bacterium]|jgi:predicted Zn-dependent protease|nr:M48 family metallopeptidase [Syntrophales bacterium]HPX54936.1 M48 family metallopeptidase [Syntrophales bacterium]HQA82031.1 M48 family metallopeptidase [Syntrophales bacterium]